MPPEPPENEPQEASATALVVAGLLIVVGAFLSAPIILMLRTPSGH